MKSQNVEQSPPDLIKSLGDSAVLNCSHSIKDFEVILWFKQDGRRFILFGYINLNFYYPEDELKQKISFAGDGRNNATLTINKLTAADNGVFYCAARRHSV